MANLDASTWISAAANSSAEAMALASTHIATIVDTRVIKMLDIRKEGSEFHGYIVSVNKEIHPAS